MLQYFLALLGWWHRTVILQTLSSQKLFKEGEIWWCSIGMNIGVEIYGKGKRFTRPVLVFKKFSANSFLGIPLTTQQKTGSWYVPIQHGEKKRMAILSQIRIFDAKRLTQKVGMLSMGNFQKIIDAFLIFYDPQKIVTPPREGAGIGG
ncbi:MAG: type II toxin-antitoxin system PemK/MazF family toxin [Minisyncoccia bacterium]|jgi:mRNA interferase MazF